MKKIKNILALLVVALMGLSLTACSEDDLDTNQYQQGVHLNVYGPQPVMRGGQLRFLGSNLDQIAQIQIPGCEPITNIEVVKAGIPSEIKITVPKDGPEVGYLTLTSKTDEKITTKTQLTYEEPIVFEKFSPASVMPGETLTIEGDYLNLVHMVEFADGVQVPEKDFISHSRYKIEVVVPKEARTGKINLFDLDLTTVEDPSVALYNIMESEDALNVGTPTITKWSSPRGEAELTGNVTAKMGETITVTGNHFGLVKSLLFRAQDRGAELLQFTTSEDGKTLTFVLPEEAPDGDFSLLALSGVEIPVGTLTTVAPSECVATPSPAKAGAQLVITGKDLDVVNSIEMPNVEGEIKFIVNPDGTKLIIESVPETATEGNLVLRMKNGKGTEVPFTLVKPVVTGYDHSTVSAGGALTIKGTNLDLVKKVQFGESSDEVEVEAAEDGTSITLTVPMNAVSGKPTLILANGTSVEGLELSINEAIFCYITQLPDFSSKENMPEAGSTLTVPVKNGDKLEEVYVNGQKVNFVYAEKNAQLTFAIPTEASANSTVKLVSSNGQIEYTISVIPAGSITKTLMTGPFDFASWGANTQGLIAQNSLDDIPAGGQVALKFHYTVTGSNPQMKVCTGDWGNIDLTTGEYKEYVFNLDANEKVLEVALTEKILSALKAKSTDWGGLMILIGNDAILNKVEAEITIPQEKTIWSGKSDIVGWGGNQDLAWGGYDWSTVKPGTTIRFYYTKVTAGSWGCISLRHGQGWGNLPAPIPGQYDFPDDSGNIEVTLTAEVIQDLVDNGGLVLTGDNFTLTKVTLE